MYSELHGYIPVRAITCDYNAGDEDYSTLQLRFGGVNFGDGGISIIVHAETPEMRAIFAAINSAINMPALVKPLAELDAEAAEYEETRKVAVCEDCGQAHG